MRIRITKEHNGHRLICTRRNGTFTQSALGPSLPFHDLAHFVVERELHFTQGFFGLIAEGYSIDQLSDPAVIRTLPAEALAAEVITRCLQGLINGAIAQRDFRAAVEAELPRAPKSLTDEAITRMLSLYVDLLNQWENVTEGSALELRWN